MTISALLLVALFSQNASAQCMMPAAQQSYRGWQNLTVALGTGIVDAHTKHQLEEIRKQMQVPVQYKTVYVRARFRPWKTIATRQPVQSYQQRMREQTRLRKEMFYTVMAGMMRQALINQGAFPSIP